MIPRVVWDHLNYHFRSNRDREHTLPPPLQVRSRIRMLHIAALGSYFGRFSLRFTSRIVVTMERLIGKKGNRVQALGDSLINAFGTWLDLDVLARHDYSSRSKNNIDDLTDFQKYVHLVDFQ